MFSPIGDSVNYINPLSLIRKPTTTPVLFHPPTPGPEPDRTVVPQAFGQKVLQQFDQFITDAQNNLSDEDAGKQSLLTFLGQARQQLQTVLDQPTEQTWSA
jgi:hypothetical protein